MRKCEYQEDEDLLLDDENANQKNFSSNWTSTKSNWDQNSFFSRENSSRITMDVGSESNDHLEDSPLLIDEFYGNSVEPEFHCHHSLTSSDDSNAWKKLSSAALFCGIFMVAELIGGYIAGSLAVMTDAAHLFSDLIGFLISLLAIWIGKRPPTKSMTFGFYRGEVIGALLSVLTIWLLSAILSTLAINRIYSQDFEIDANTMIIISSLGLFVNIIMGAILHGVCHTHSHGLSQHSHSSSNINVRAAAVHVLGDLLQSLGVLIAAIIIKFKPSAKIADPICTLAFSVIVICTTIKVGRDSLWFLLEGSPTDTIRLKNEIKKISGIKHVHNLHAWALSPGKNIVTVHLAVDQNCDRDVLLRKVASAIQSQITVISFTIQIEAYNYELINLCNECQNHQW